MLARGRGYHSSVNQCIRKNFRMLWLSTPSPRVWQWNHWFAYNVFWVHTRCICSGCTHWLIFESINRIISAQVNAYLTVNLKKISKGHIHSNFYPSCAWPMIFNKIMKLANQNTSYSYLPPFCNHIVGNNVFYHWIPTGRVIFTVYIALLSLDKMKLKSNDVTTSKHIRAVCMFLDILYH